MGVRTWKWGCNGLFELDVCLSPFLSYTDGPVALLTVQLSVFILTNLLICSIGCRNDDDAQLQSSDIKFDSTRSIKSLERMYYVMLLLPCKFKLFRQAAISVLKNNALCRKVTLELPDCHRCDLIKSTVVSLHKSLVIRVTVAF